MHICDKGQLVLSMLFTCAVCMTVTYACRLIHAIAYMYRESAYRHVDLRPLIITQC